MLKLLQITNLIHFLAGDRELHCKGYPNLSKKKMSLDVSHVINEEKNPEGSSERRQNCREQCV